MARHQEDKSLLEKAFSWLGHNAIDDIQKAGESLGRIFENTVSIHAILRAEIQTLLDRGYPTAGLADLDAATADYRRWNDLLAQKWPWLDHGALKKSFASYESGQFRPLKDFLDELQYPANSGSGR